MAEDQNDKCFQHLAGCIRCGYIDGVQALIKTGRVDLNARNESAMSLIQIACSRDKEIANVSASDRCSIIRQLIQAGASCSLVSGQKANMAPLVLLGGTIEDAKDACHIFWEIVELLIDSSAEVNGATRDDGKNLWHLICSAEWKDGAFDARIALLLLERGPEGVLDAPEIRKDQTPLHILCEKATPNKELLQLLLQHGASLELSDRDNKVPIHQLVAKDDSSYFRLVASCSKEYNFTTWNQRKNHFFLLAVRLNAFTILQECLEDGSFEIDQICIQELNKADTLHKLCSGKPDSALLHLAKVLIDVAGVDVNARNRAEETPLHCCVGDFGGKKIEVVRKLIRRGADVNAICGRKGQTPLHRVLMDGHPFKTIDLVRLLVCETKANVNINDDDFQRTPLFYAQSKPIAQLLLQNGADASLKSKNGDTVLHHKELSVPVFQYVLKAKGLPVDVQNDRGDTPLHVACRFLTKAAFYGRKAGGSKVVKKINSLVKHGANPSKENKDGLTPFMVLCQSSSNDQLTHDTIKEFIARFGKGILNHESSKGMTPLAESLADFSDWYSCRRTVKLLVDNGANLFATNKDGLDIFEILAQRNWRNKSDQKKAKKFFQREQAKQVHQIHCLVSYLGENDWFSRTSFTSRKRRAGASGM